MTGDLNLYTPGARVPVSVVAAADGSVPERGDLVQLAGETRDGVEVTTQSDGHAIGHVMRQPLEYDEDETYADGDVVGDSTVLLRAHVDWLKTADPSVLSPGDTVAADGSGGVDAYDEAGGDTALDALGYVWRTGTHADGTTDKVAVVRTR